MEKGREVNNKKEDEMDKKGKGKGNGKGSFVATQPALAGLLYPELKGRIFEPTGERRFPEMGEFYQGNTTPLGHEDADIPRYVCQRSKDGWDAFMGDAERIAREIGTVKRILREVES